jgi:hypothetical protein
VPKLFTIKIAYVEKTVIGREKMEETEPVKRVR